MTVSSEDQEESADMLKEALNNSRDGKLHCCPQGQWYNRQRISPSVSSDLWADDKVRGVVGRAIRIDCHYAPMYRSHTKYFCHIRSHQCTSLVNTNGQTEQTGRMTIRDKTSQGIFTVTMENLVFQDTGVYRCGIATSGKTLVIDVQLQVYDVSSDLWADDKVRGVVGRAIRIDCHYAPMYRSHTKYFCRIRSHQCTSLVNTNGQTEQTGRMTIRDKTSQGIFTVTMENLVFQDTGVYRCGIATSGKTLVIDVQLQVYDGRFLIDYLYVSSEMSDAYLFQYVPGKHGYPEAPQQCRRCGEWARVGEPHMLSVH
ncbi:polymeric immunoglobulin receptor-like [Hypanus sabinus]|uniref:polymeric immunoglobulin receptor-like n=1 Tax=Hypanus sabinus TaxID=79690 RepID=UPI0028C3CE13|nr:polymeric immunoglobulin receptor-like [Hypanus sabinus]